MENWDDIRVFLAVARAESLSGAAPGLKMDPATLSRRINRLEQSLGAVLFVKSPKGYTLTDLGERMRDRAAAAEAELALVRDEGQGASPLLTGQIRIGAPDGAANFLLPQVCAALQAENPELEIQILALPRVVNLSHREADMAITVSPPATGKLSVRRITDYKLHLAARHDGPAIRSIADLQGRAVVGYIPDMIFDKELDYLGDLGARGVQLASNSVAVQLQMIRQAGIGIVHDFALAFAPELRRVLVDEVSLTRSFYLVRHMSDRQSDRLNRISNAIIKGIQAEVERLELIASLTGGTAIWEH
ncbi:LysR family transcriptional regulator [Loktanella sp. S4079]|uniref:LysR family transcriptional regulator n=1 Tax=Loktanella sp. S4079 TaxID=579483 RepID=UPI0005F9BD12|nr:LysR family transcriptional regulator [Loktanella sp. S4079]KJZ20961.1 LysR family transcriptional regulator [Loktanella sp. S4079]